MATIIRTQKGRFAKAYIDPTSEIAGTATTELTMIRDGDYVVTPSMESTTVRADGRHDKEESFAVKVTGSFNLRVYSTSALTPGYTTLRDACLNGDPVHLFFSDQDKSNVGAEILEGWFEVSGFTRSFPLDGHCDVPITFTETSALIVDGETATRTPNAKFTVVAAPPPEPPPEET